MATQQAATIDFSIARNFTGFQLVELPEELLELIADHKTDAPVLELKSEASGNAVLCAPNKTFPIRSVHTSNSLYVVQPAVRADQGQDAIPSYGIQAISSCAATIELSKSIESALPYLRKALPLYSSRDLNAAAAAKSSFDTICADIPLSNGELQDAWSAICAFEEQGASYRPTADILLQLWKAITVAAVAENMDLTGAFLVEDLWTTVKDEDFPRGLFDAFLQRVEDRNSMDVDAESKWCTIDKARCLECIALLVLETRAAVDQTIAVSDFLDTWRDNIAEKWSSELSVGLVQSFTIQPTPTTIMLKPECRLSGVPASVAEVSDVKAPTKTRKWHEKFRKTRT